MHNPIDFFKRKAALIAPPDVVILTSAVPLQLVEKCQTGARLLTRMSHQFGIFKQSLFHPEYYDPYQQKEHAEYLRINGIEEYCAEIVQPPVKPQYRPMASSLISGMVRWFSSSATKVFTGYEKRLTSSFAKAAEAARQKKTGRREKGVRLAPLVRLFGYLDYPLQQAGERFRRIFIPNQHQEDIDPLLDARFFPPLAMEAYRQALNDEKNAWGIVARDNLSVHFIRPFAPSIFSPPPKPKRAHARLSLVSKKQMPALTAL